MSTKAKIGRGTYKQSVQMWKQQECDVENWHKDSKKTLHFFKRLFINVDKIMAKQKIFDNGCTVCTVLLERINNETYAVVSNLGVALPAEKKLCAVPHAARADDAPARDRVLEGLGWSHREE